MDNNSQVIDDIKSQDKNAEDQSQILKTKRKYNKSRDMIDEIKVCIEENNIISIRNGEMIKKEILNGVNNIMLESIVKIANLIHAKEIDVIPLNDPKQIEVINIEKTIKNGTNNEHDRSFIDESKLIKTKNLETNPAIKKNTTKGKNVQLTSTPNDDLELQEFEKSMKFYNFFKNFK